MMFLSDLGTRENFQFGTPDHEGSLPHHQQLQALGEELAALNEKVDAVQQDIDKLNIQAETLEKKARSLHRVSNVALAMGGALALYLLDFGIKQVRQNYFA